MVPEAFWRVEVGRTQRKRLRTFELLTLLLAPRRVVASIEVQADIETTIVPDKKGGFGSLPTPLIVLCGGFP